MNQYRCETCSHYLKNAIACNKIKERLIVGADEWIEKVGCASHGDFQSGRDIIVHQAGSSVVRRKCDPKEVEQIRKDERDTVLDAKRAFLGKIAIRVRREFAQDDDEEFYLCSDDFENVLDELNQELKDEEQEELRQNKTDSVFIFCNTPAHAFRLDLKNKQTKAGE